MPGFEHAYGVHSTLLPPCYRDLPPEVLEGCAAVRELLQDVGRQLSALAQQVQRGLRVVSQVRRRRVWEVGGCGGEGRWGREGKGEDSHLADDRGLVGRQTGHGLQVVGLASR